MPNTNQNQIFKQNQIGLDTYILLSFLLNKILILMSYSTSFKLHQIVS